MSGPLPDFGGLWLPGGVGAPAVVVPVQRPNVLRGRGLQLVSKAAFTWTGVVYDMFVVQRQSQGWWKVVQFVKQGERDMAAVWCGGKKWYVHRLVAFNTACPPATRGAWDDPRRWGNPRGLPWPWRRSEVHHHQSLRAPRRYPWRDSKRRNMVVMWASEHREWHGRPCNAGIDYVTRER